jgi:hypothetical protein
MPYTPVATDYTQPADAGVKASTAAAEFRTLKQYIQQTVLPAIALLAPIASPTFTGTLTAANIIDSGAITVGGNASIAGALTLTGALTVGGSAAFTVSPTAPTPAFGDSSTKVATMAALAAAGLTTALPGVASGVGLGITSDGTQAFWGNSAAASLAILNFIGA